jgi:hypothetical protein
MKRILAMLLLLASCTPEVPSLAERFRQCKALCDEGQRDVIEFSARYYEADHFDCSCSRDRRASSTAFTFVPIVDSGE